MQKPTRVRTSEARFWSKVKGGEACWLWQGATTGSLGYGHFRGRGGVHEYAHRVSWEMAHGPIPDGALVLHRCDVPTCVRPDHLYLGTNTDNANDRALSDEIRRTARSKDRPIGTMILSVRIPQDLVEKLDEACMIEQRPRSTVLRQAILFYVARYHAKKIA